jgi:hypothetical protein
MARRSVKVKINRKEFARQTSRVRTAKQVKDLAYKSAQEKAKEAKKELIQEFDQNRITKELEAGSGNTKNISRTLLGLPYGQGSLYGFIGFVDGTNPIDEVRSYLKGTGHVNKSARLQKRGVRGGSYEFKVEVPDMNAIEALTPMPWEGGRSWTRAIERGISGLSNYMLNHSASSRSGQGIQSKNRMYQAAMYKPTKYLSAMINNYVRILQGRKPKI